MLPKVVGLVCVTPNFRRIKMSRRAVPLLLMIFIGLVFANSVLSIDPNNLVAYWSFNKGFGGFNGILDEIKI